jgi:hypothetical protein
VKPALRLTTVVCETCRATTTRNWSRTCNACSKALLAALANRKTRYPQHAARTREPALGQPDRPVSECSRKKATVMNIIGGCIVPLTCGYASQVPVLAGNGHKSAGRLAVVKAFTRQLAGLPASTREELHKTLATGEVLT